MSRIPGVLAVAASLLVALTCRANDIPARPPQYFNDYANVVDPGTASQLNSELEDFERQTSSQIVVAVYPKLQTDDALDDYCYRVFQAWGVGQKKLNNGAALFVFVQDHKMRIQTGYGLEGALPDITCVRIQDDTMAPYFKQGDYAGGLRAGVHAMIAAAKGEYKGNGQTVADQNAQGEDTRTADILLGVVISLLVILSLFRRTRGVLYGSNGIGSYLGWMLLSGGGGGGWGGGGGGGFSGGGGGFSGGGGSSGGGGASGSW
jgi:uncharacterized protein